MDNYFDKEFGGIFKKNYNLKVALTFPARAELMKNNPKFRGYKIFLDHWLEYIIFLADSYQNIYTRDESFCLVVYGPQGIGKSLFADKLMMDFLLEPDIYF